jgi:hypothetical protein
MLKNSDTIILGSLFYERPSGYHQPDIPKKNSEFLSFSVVEETVSKPHYLMVTLSKNAEKRRYRKE